VIVASGTDLNREMGNKKTGMDDAVVIHPGPVAEPLAGS